MIKFNIIKYSKIFLNILQLVENIFHSKQKENIFLKIVNFFATKKFFPLINFSNQTNINFLQPS